MINKQKIIEELHLIPTGTKGWFTTECPWCSTSDGRFGIILNETGVSSFNCFRGSCGEKGTLFKFLKKINRLDLLNFEREYNINNKLEAKISISDKEIIDYSMPVRKLPLGYQRIYKNEYLDKRGFDFNDYIHYEVGLTTLDPHFKNDYIILPISEGGEYKGFFARSIFSKEWHEQNLKDFKNDKSFLKLRYDNSIDTDFSYYLYGINEVNEKTKIVILTEGAFSKIAVDKKLGLHDNDLIKCCSCFGQKVSKQQIKRLQDKNIGNVILLFDNNTFTSTKTYSVELSKYFNVKVGYIRQKDKDPDDITQEQLFDVMEHLEDPFGFNYNRLSTKLLK